MNVLRLWVSFLWSVFLRASRSGKPLYAFARAERGAAAMYFALSSPIWIGGLALGAEVGSWYYFQQKLQATADAVAVSVAGRVGTGPSQAEIDNLANYFLTRNQFSFSQGTWEVTLSNPPVASVFVEGSSVNVRLTRSVRRFMSSFFQRGDFVIQVNASAQVRRATEGCILASGIAVFAGGLEVTNSADVQVNGCEVLSNGDLFAVRAGQRLVTDCARSVNDFIVAGTLNVACRNGPFREAGITLDPYLDLPDLDLSAIPCSLNGSAASKTIWNTGEWSTKVPTRTYNGRTYARMCGGAALSVSASPPGTTVDIPNWTFIFDGVGSNLNISSNATGTDVSFYFTGGARAIVYAPSSVVTLSANASGMLFRGARTNAVSNNQFIVGLGSSFQGAIYFPASPVIIQARGSFVGCPQIIGRTVQIWGTWQLNGPCRAPGVRPIVASRAVDLTQ